MKFFEWWHEGRLPPWTVLVGIAVGLVAGADSDVERERERRAYELVLHLEPIPRESIVWRSPRCSAGSAGSEHCGPRYFLGDYACEATCEGHLAGWRWAARQNVTSIDRCRDSGSTSFFEGCSLFLEARRLADHHD